MGLFGGDSKSEQITNVRTDTTQIAGGDVGESAIVGAGGSQITVNNSGGDSAFGFASGLAETAFGTIREISGQSRDIQRSALIGESAVLSNQESGERIKLYLIGAGILLTALFYTSSGRK